MSESAKGPWKVNAKGGPNDTFEITVIHESFDHGFVSYGWIGELKRFVSGCSSRTGVDEDTWLDLMDAAERLAARLNKAAEAKR